jgi:hypothetical protein
MIGIEAQTEFSEKPVKDAEKRAAYENLGHAAASLRKAAIASIEESSRPSEPGRPIHTRRGLARRAILYAVDRENEEAVVGFSAERIGDAMAAHELGEIYKGAAYPQRPTMIPALEASADRMGDQWRGSIGQ